MQNEFVCLKTYLDDTQDLLVRISHSLTHSDRNQFCECVSGFFLQFLHLFVWQKKMKRKKSDDQKFMLRQ